MLARTKQTLRSLLQRFTMIELVIALVVIVVAVISIMVLLPKGLDANRGSMSRATAVSALQQFLRYSQNRIHGDWHYVDAFPDAKSYAAADPDHMEWSTESLSPSQYLELLWLVNEGSPDADFDPQIHNSGLFKIIHRSSANDISFSAIVRAWKEVRDYGDGSDATAKTAVLFAEVSWPAELPYTRRNREVYQITMFLPGEVSVLVVDVFEDEIYESDGENAASGRVARVFGDLSVGLRVNLTSSDTAEAVVAPEVTIPANESAATFSITGVDDAIEDGTKRVTITAQPAEADSEYRAGNDSFNVLDDEISSLRVIIAASSMSENGGSSSATVERLGGNLDRALPVTLTTSDQTQAVPSTTHLVLSPGTSSATFMVLAVDDNILDGDQVVSITASNNAYTSGSDSILVTDHETITISVAPTTVTEGSGANVATGSVTRSDGATPRALVVSLSSSDGRVHVPDSVTIAAGKDSASYAVDVTSNDELDPPTLVTLSAANSNYETGTAALTVVDQGSLSLSLSASMVVENAGEAAAYGTVTRNVVDPDHDLTVQLASSDTSEITVPASVTIPIGRTSATFAINAVEDKLLDGEQNVTVSASAAQHTGDTASITVEDAEFLTVAVSVPLVWEKDDNPAAVATISRSNTDPADPQFLKSLVVNLSSSDTTELTVPTTVTIPPGQASVTAALSVVDDNLVDGDQSVTVVAGANGYASGESSILVRDIDTATLTLAFTPAVIDEDDGEHAATGTVTRNTSLTDPLVVQLTSSDTSEATVPTQVTLSAGANSATFAVDAIDDDEADGDQAVEITASADLHGSASATINVRDVDHMLLVVVAPDTFARNAGDQAAIGTVTRVAASLANALNVSLSSGDPASASVPGSVTIQADASTATFYVAAGAGDGDDEDTSIAGGININPNNSPHMEFTLQTAGGATYTRDDLHKDSPISGDGTFYQGGATYMLVKPKGNGNQNTLYINGKIYPLRNSSIYTFSGAMTVRVYNAKPKNGKAMGHWWVSVSGDGIVVTEDGKRIGEADPAADCNDVRVAISASASGYKDGVEAVTVTCAPLVLGSLGLTVEPSSFADTSGDEAAIATLTRDSDPAAALTVALSSSDVTAATVPESIVIPAGETSVTFHVGAVDDGLLAGARTAEITAAATAHAEAIVTVTLVDSYFGAGLFVKERIRLTGSSQIVGTAITNSTSANSVELDWSAIITGDLVIGPGGIATTVLKTPRPNELDNIGGDVANLPRELEFELPPFPQFPEGTAKSNIKLSGGASNDRTLRPSDYDGCSFGSIEILHDRRLTFDLQGQARTIRVGNLDIVQGHIVLIGGGSLTFYIDGGITLGGDSTINASGSTDSAHIYYAGGGAINPGGNTRYAGSLYSLSADIVIPGSSGIMGHIVSGGANISVTGDASALVRVMYAPDAKVLVTGSGKIRGGLVCRELEGTGNIRIVHSGDNTVPIRDLPGQ